MHLWIKGQPDQDRLECQKLDEGSKGKQFDVLFQVPKNYVGHSLKIKKFSIRWQKKFDQNCYHSDQISHFFNETSLLAWISGPFVNQNKLEQNAIKILTKFEYLLEFSWLSVFPFEIFLKIIFIDPLRSHGILINIFLFTLNLWDIPIILIFPHSTIWSLWQLLRI